jgi:hypothetical protein
MGKYKELFLQLETNDPSLTEIGYDCCNLRDDDIAPIAQRLNYNTTVIELYLDGNDIGNDGA